MCEADIPCVLVCIARLAKRLEYFQMFSYLPGALFLALYDTGDTKTPCIVLRDTLIDSDKFACSLRWHYVACLLPVSCPINRSNLNEVIRRRVDRDLYGSPAHTKIRSPGKWCGLDRLQHHADIDDTASPNALFKHDSLRAPFVCVLRLTPLNRLFRSLSRVSYTHP